MTAPVPCPGHLALCGIPCACGGVNPSNFAAGAVVSAVDRLVWLAWTSHRVSLADLMAATGYDSDRVCAIIHAADAADLPAASGGVV